MATSSNLHVLPPVVLEGPASFPVGDAIRIFRLRSNLSLGDMERSSGMPRSYLSRVEDGHAEPTLSNLKRLAVTLGVTMAAIVEEAERLEVRRSLTVVQAV